MIYDPAREQATISGSGRNPVQVLQNATALYANTEGHNPKVLEVMESRVESVGAMQRAGIPMEVMARFYYDALVGVGALELDACKAHPTIIDAIAAAQHPAPVYHWCKGQYDQYSFEVNDGNPRNLDLSKKDDYLATGRELLMKVKEAERRGKVPDQEDIDFFSGLFADVHARSQAQFLESLADSREPSLVSKVQ